MKKILVAEDDNFLSKIYQQKLTTLGYKVLLFRTGNDIAKVAKETQPDLIILDLLMPEKDGYKVLAELKEVEETKNLPVLVLSNLSQDMDIKKAEELGANTYMVKSDSSFEEVSQEIKRLTQ